MWCPASSSGFALRTVWAPRLYVFPCLPHLTCLLLHTVNSKSCPILTSLSWSIPVFLTQIHHSSCFWWSHILNGMTQPSLLHAYFILLRSPWEMTACEPVCRPMPILRTYAVAFRQGGIGTINFNFLYCVHRENEIHKGLTFAQNYRAAQVEVVLCGICDRILFCFSELDFASTQFQATTL